MLYENWLNPFYLSKSLVANEPLKSTQTNTDIQVPRILEDSYIGFMMHPVGSHMSHNMPLALVMAQNVIEHLEDFSIAFSDVCFVAQGSSGCIIAALIASQMPGSMIWDIKKPGQSSHSHHVRCIPDKDKYMIFVDDFISSGKTLYRCYGELKKQGRLINCVAVTGRISWTIFDKHPVDVIICQEYNRRIEVNKSF